MGKDERSFISREEYDALLAENAELNKKLDYLMGQLRLLKQKTFGVSSEQATEQLVGQLSLLFNEAEAWTPKEYPPKAPQCLPTPGRSAPAIWMAFCQRTFR